LLVKFHIIIKFKEVFKDIVLNLTIFLNKKKKQVTMAKLEKVLDYLFIGVSILIVVFGIFLFVKPPVQQGFCSSSNNLSCSNVFFTDSFLSFDLENNQGVDFLLGTDANNFLNNSDFLLDCVFAYQEGVYYNTIYSLQGDKLSVNCPVEDVVLSNSFPLTFKFYYRRLIDSSNMTKVAEVSITKNDVGNS